MQISKRALIIGVSGQDGAYLAQRLLEKGYKVWGTSRDHEVASFANLHRLGIKGDVELVSMIASDFRSVLTVLQRAQADEIYNLAGQTSVALSFEYPVETFDSILIGTMNLLECIRLLKRPTKFYHAGSSEAFGNTFQAANEQTPYRPRSPYATAKSASHYATTNYREAYGLYACTGILFNHESPLRPARFVTSKIVSTAVRIAGGSPEKLALGRLDVCRDWGWAPDYVEAMWRMLQEDEADDYVIATGEEHSLQEFVTEVFSQLGLDWRDHVERSESLLRPSDIERSYGDPSKAKEKLGWEAKHRFREVIRLLVEAERQKC